MNYEAITIQDCLDNYFMKNVAAVINDGQVIEFIKENKKSFPILRISESQIENKL